MHHRHMHSCTATSALREPSTAASVLFHATRWPRGHSFCTMQFVISLSGQGRCDCMLSRHSHVTPVRHQQWLASTAAGSDPTVVGGQCPLSSPRDGVCMCVLAWARYFLYAVQDVLKMAGKTCVHECTHTQLQFVVGVCA